MPPVTVCRRAKTQPVNKVTKVAKLGSVKQVEKDCSN
jgi:hypothetical protein